MQARSGVVLDRKILSGLAMYEPFSFKAVVDALIPFFVTRQIFAGAGKVLQTPRGFHYCLSQRAQHICQEISGATTSSRSIINTRDEPHADPEKYRRLHVIIGDANMNEVTTYLKVGTTAIVLAMIEAARTNARSVRTALTREVWEAVNESWMLLKDVLARPVREAALGEVLGAVRAEEVTSLATLGADLRARVFGPDPECLTRPVLSLDLAGLFAIAADMRDPLTANMICAGTTSGERDA